MDPMLDNLRLYGADMDGAMSRFLDDIDLYKTCFTVFLADESFPKLGEALAAMDYEAAFEYAHTLKGVTGNMGLTPLYQVLCHLVAMLRSREYAGIKNDYAKIMEHLSRLRSLQE